jgi:Polyketide cyclase / dehydrase and lipid transport
MRLARAYPLLMRGSVTVHMAAPAIRVWDLVADVTRIGEFSPETFEAEWLPGSDGPVAGARFRGHVRRNGRGPVYWTACTVTGSDPGRLFAFRVAAPGGKTVNTWRYELSPRTGGTNGGTDVGAAEDTDGGAAGGTDVTESFELADSPVLRLYWKLAGRARLRTNLNGMRITLEKIKAIAESAD